MPPQRLLAPAGTLQADKRPQDARFGYALAAVPDLNHDGFGDAVVGAPLEDGHRGALYVYHGAPGTLLPQYKQVRRDWEVLGGGTTLYEPAVKPPLTSPLSASASRRRRWMPPSAISGAAWTGGWTWTGTGWWTWRWGRRGQPCCCGESWGRGHVVGTERGHRGATLLRPAWHLPHRPVPQFPLATRRRAWGWGRDGRGVTLSPRCQLPPHRPGHHVADGGTGGHQRHPAELPARRHRRRLPAGQGLLPRRDPCPGPAGQGHRWVLGTGRGGGTEHPRVSPEHPRVSVDVPGAPTRLPRSIPGVSPTPRVSPGADPRPCPHPELRFNVSLEEGAPGARAAFDSGARRLLQRHLELSPGRASCLRFPFHVLVSRGRTLPGARVAPAAPRG